MRPAIATVVSPRPWEGRLVQAAADTGLVRLTARAFNPADIQDVAAVVVGTEVPWLRTTHVLEWKSRRIAVLGMYPRGDRPAIARLCTSGVDQLFVEDVDPVVVLRAIRDIVGDESGEGNDLPMRPYTARLSRSSLVPWPRPS